MNDAHRPTDATRCALKVCLATLTVAVATALCSPTVQAQATTAVAATSTDDGVVLISNERALAGIGNGDAAGFPVNLLRSGTYRLTSNLVVPAGLDAIQVADAISVVIDLNGFQIVGGAACNATMLCPTDVDGTAGIRTMGPSSFTTVRNGRVRGFSYAALGSTSMFIGRMALQDLVLEQNGSGARLRVLQAHRVLVHDNSTMGLVGTTLTVSDSQAIANGGSGFAGTRGTVRDSTAYDNKNYGFMGSAVLLQGNVAVGNRLGATYGGVNTPGTNAF